MFENFKPRSFTQKGGINKTKKLVRSKSILPLPKISDTVNDQILKS